MAVDFGCDKLSLDEKYQFNRLYIANLASSDSVITILNWKATDTAVTKEKIVATTSLGRNETTRNTVYSFDLAASRFVLFGEEWNINKSLVVLDTSSIFFKKCRLDKGTQSLQLSGKISEYPLDTLYCNFKDLQLNNLNLVIDKADAKFDGIANGDAYVMNVYNNPKFFSDLNIHHFTLNNEDLGTCIVAAHWFDDQKKVHIDARSGKTEVPTLVVQGDYYPGNYRLDFEIGLNKFVIRPLAMYMEGILSGMTGFTTGSMKLTGTTDSPKLNGMLIVQRGSFLVDYLKARYYFSTPIEVDNNKFIVKNAIFTDDNAKEAKVQAWVYLQNLSDISFDIVADAEDFIFMKTKAADNEYFYGDAYGTGIIKLSGTPSNVLVDVSARTNKNTHVSIPLITGDIEEKKFITFVNRKQQGDENLEKITSFKVIQSTTTEGMILNLNIEVTPDAEVELIFDPVIGDALNAQGKGNIRLEMDNLGKFNMYGRYSIEEGDYNFSLKSLISKHFKIEKGGYIEWQGDPMDASLDMKTIYRTRSSLYGVIPDNGEQYKTKIPVECWLFLSGKLLNPTIKYDIYLPNATEDTRTKLKSVLNTESELSKQFLALLIVNTFISCLLYTSNTMIHQYLPSLLPSSDSTFQEESDNNFTFTAYFKKTKPFTAFFMPELSIAENTFLNGNYDPGQNDANISLTSDYIPVSYTHL